MKKVLKIIGTSLLGIIIVVYVFSFIAYNAYKPDKVKIKVETEALNYFNETYEECRSDFLSESNKLMSAYQGVQSSMIKVAGKVDPDLFIDITYVPAQDTTISLLILASGLHGVEGFTGGAIQLMVMNELLAKQDLSQTGILFVHGINPYGFKNFRKVSENNVDLNRNCAIDPSLYNVVNEGYGKLVGLLGPDNEADHANSKNRNFHVIAIQKILAESMGALKQAALQGQYDYPKGIYYGGKKPEPQLEDLALVLKDVMEDYSRVMTIDLHTGYGANGILHLFINPIDDLRVKSSLEAVFEGHKIKWGNEDDFYTILGSFVDWVGSLTEVDLYMPMLFEYGTLDSEKTLGSITSIQNMILENQGYHYGYKNERAEAKIKDRFREMYYPSSPEWRTKVINDTRAMLEQVFEKLGE